MAPQPLRLNLAILGSRLRLHFDCPGRHDTLTITICSELLSGEEKSMGETIRVRVKDGVLEPLEQMNLPEGKEVVISVVTIVEDPDEEAFLRSAGSWKDLIDAEEFIRKVYEDRLLNSRENPQL